MRLLPTVALSVSLLSAEPVRLHPANPHYFLFRGRPAVLVTSGEHYGSVLNLDFDYRRYLETLEQDGMNLTRLFSGTYVEKPGAFGIERNTLAPAPGRYLAPWARADGKFDLDRWNAAYFERLKGFLSEAAKRGIVVELTLFSSQYTDDNWALSAFNPANNVNGTDAIDRRVLNTLENGNILPRQETVVRKIVSELNGFDNLIYEIQNEPWSDRTVTVDVINPYLKDSAVKVFPNSVDLADELSMAWQDRVASWITSEEAKLPNRHLIAQNYANFRGPVRRLAPGVSIVNFHYAYPEAVDDNYGIDRLISYDETGFAGSADSTYRKQAWNFMLAGGGAFDGLDYSFTVGHEDGTDTAPNGPGGGSPALRKQLKVLRDFLASFDLPSMRPDRTIVVHAAGVRYQALSSPGNAYAIYFSGEGPSEIRLRLPKGNYSAEWINPETGAVLAREPANEQLTTPPFKEDVALRIRP